MENGRDALDYLGHSNPFSGKGTVLLLGDITIMVGINAWLGTLDVFHDETMDGCIKLESVMCFARGKAYLLIKEIDNARDCFKEALNIDVKCYDALEALVQYNMMEEKAGQLLNSTCILSTILTQYHGGFRVGICHDATL